MSSQVLTTQVLPAWARLLRAHAATTRRLSAELFAEHGLTINDFEALLHLSHAEDCAMRRVDLAEQLVLTASGVTRLLDGLERAGFVGKGNCESLTRRRARISRRCTRSSRSASTARSSRRWPSYSAACPVRRAPTAATALLSRPSSSGW